MTGQTGADETNIVGGTIDLYNGYCIPLADTFGGYDGRVDENTSEFVKPIWSFVSGWMMDMAATDIYPRRCRGLENEGQSCVAYLGTGQWARQACVAIGPEVLQKLIPRNQYP